LSLPAQPIPNPPNPDEPQNALARRSPRASLIPTPPENFAFPARSDANPAARPPQETPPKKADQNTVLRGLKDLQQLQKQTLAVLEAVKGSLDGIQDVLRSPEAARGLEKQKNAATLLSRGFPRDAVEQASGAAALLPANPETHLLLALSLAADQQLDHALAATRKGLALVDRRSHPLAIEAGLLHTLSVLGDAAEAIDRWSLIIDGLPLPVLLEQTACIAACFPAPPIEPAAPTDAPASASDLLDALLSDRLKLAETPPTRGASRQRLIDTAPLEIPAPFLITALDASTQANLPKTRRAILRQIAYRLRGITSAPDVVRFLTDCVVPLGNRGLNKATQSLARSAIKRLLQLGADAPTLYRAMEKLQMAGDSAAAGQIANLLWRWRTAGTKADRARAALFAGAGLLAAAVVMLALAFGPLNGSGSARPTLIISSLLLAAGMLLAFLSVYTSTSTPAPANRGPLTPDEIRFLRPLAMRTSLRAALQTTPR
jgi:hypothetical protein